MSMLSNFFLFVERSFAVEMKNLQNFVNLSAFSRAPIDKLTQSMVRDK